jgi:hypothetical protein
LPEIATEVHSATPALPEIATKNHSATPLREIAAENHSNPLKPPFVPGLKYKLRHVDDVT